MSLSLTCAHEHVAPVSGAVDMTWTLYERGVCLGCGATLTRTAPIGPRGPWEPDQPGPPLPLRFACVPVPPSFGGSPIPAPGVESDRL